MLSALRSTWWQELDLADNRIGPDGCRALVAALVQCSALAWVRLVANEINDEAAASAAATLEEAAAARRQSAETTLPIAELRLSPPGGDGTIVWGT